MQPQILANTCEHQAYEIYSNQSLNVKNLCSRKLFELLLIDENQPLSQKQQKVVERELVSRQHYLRELGKLRGLC